MFAAGDVAAAWHPFLERRLRIEHWHNALEQGPAAARSMLGSGEPYDKIPYFFSDQYQVGMEYAGPRRRLGRGRVPRRRRRGEFIAFGSRTAACFAGMNVNVWDVTDDIQALFRAAPGRPRPPARPRYGARVAGLTCDHLVTLETGEALPG